MDANSLQPTVEPELEPLPPDPRPKRTGAGKGGCVRQLEKCSDAITRIPKRARNDGVHVPSDEVVNPMAPRTSPHKRRKHSAKTQPNWKNDAVSTVTVSS